MLVSATTVQHNAQHAMKIYRERKKTPYPRFTTSISQPFSTQTGVCQLPFNFLPTLVMEENLCGYVVQIFYTADVLSVTETTLSKHWRKHEALFPTSDLVSPLFILHSVIPAHCSLYTGPWHQRHRQIKKQRKNKAVRTTTTTTTSTCTRISSLTMWYKAEFSQQLQHAVVRYKIKNVH